MSRKNPITAGCPFSYRQPEGAFTQPNGEVNQKMLTGFMRRLANAKTTVELYCGNNGNFTPPLHPRAQGISHRNQQELGECGAGQSADNGVDNITLVRLSAEELNEALNEVRLSPAGRHRPEKLRLWLRIRRPAPRRYYGPDTCELTGALRAHSVHLLHLRLLAANIAQLSDHKVTRCALSDQFPHPSYNNRVCC
jgi:tRNA (uracil-5-)-methyltransferase